jgi:arylsulfatase A-like enzyme
MLLEHVSSGLLAHVFRGAFLARRLEARLRRGARASFGAHEAERAPDAPEAVARGAGRRRNILFITSDQQRYDALGINGGKVARTPVLDGLAAAGLNYRRAHVQNVVCMPSRATMLTGQHPRTHGVVCNGVALPAGAPSVARHLRLRAGYRTALVGKAHFDPHLDPTLRFFENRCAATEETGEWHGFEHLRLATHGPLVGHHYADWLWREHPRDIAGFAGVLTGKGGGDTGAPEVAHNPIPRERYHTDWVASRTIDWLSSLDADQPWFCWMSFPDPHHPFDPPQDEVRARIDWRDLALPERHPGTRDRIEAILGERPRHWLDWYQGRFRNPEGGPTQFVPAALTAAQLREIHAMIHVENELIDEACGRVLSWLGARGIDEHTDVFYTSDHGELQGDYGLLFKGPYHVDSLLRVPLLWRPAPAANVLAAEVSAPVGHVDLAPTFCQVAGVDVPEWMEGAPLPVTGDAARERVLTTFDSQFAAVGMHLRTIYRDGFICTAYEPRTRDQGGRFPLYWSVWGRGSRLPTYTGSEGELYDLREDPHQMRNLWDDPARRSLKSDLIADLYDHLPPARIPALPVAAPT